MHRVDATNHYNNTFTDGNAQTGIAPTTLAADWHNSVQEELANVVEFTGDTLDRSDNTQLLTNLIPHVGGMTALRAIAPVSGYRVYLKYHTTAGDGGHGVFRGVTGAAAATYTHDNGYYVVPSGGDGSAAWIRETDRLTVRHFGAQGDNSTDDATAIAAADVTAAALGWCLYWPAGTYLSSALIPMTANAWCGESRETSILKRKSAAVMTNLVHVGSTSGTTTKTYCSIHDMGFNGNSGCTDSVVKLRNVQHSAFGGIRVFSGSAAGFKTDTSTTTTNTNMLRNEYSNIVSYSNTGIGFHFIGEKDSRFDNLLSHDNGSDGFKFQAFVDDGNSLAETTQCVITSLLSRDNGGNGYTFDMIEKYVAGSLESTINAGRGFYFQSSITTASSYGSNSLVCGSMLSRNDAFGAIDVAETAYVYGVKIGNVLAYGSNSTLNYPGIIIRGGQAMDFGSVLVQSFKAGAVYIQDGTPLGGGTAQASKIHFGVLTLISNGNASASSNSGLTIADSSSDISIDCLVSTNSHTNATTSQYELAVSNTVGPVHIGFAHLTAATAGYEESLGTSETYITAYKRRAEVAAIGLLANGTIPTTSLTNHGLIYIDPADGDAKIRFPNGTVTTFATN